MKKYGKGIERFSRQIIGGECLVKENVKTETCMNTDNGMGCMRHKERLRLGE